MKYLAVVGLLLLGGFLGFAMGYYTAQTARFQHLQGYIMFDTRTHQACTSWPASGPDQLASQAQTQPSGGDIFDQLASQATPATGVDMSTYVPLPGGNTKQVVALMPFCKSLR